MHTSALSPTQIETIHQASLKILSEIGVTVPHPKILARFADSGANVNFTCSRVKIPEHLVQSSIASAGKRYAIYGRDLNKKAEFGVGSRNFNSTAGEALWIDEIGGPRRYPSLDDVIRATRLADALPHITIPGAMADPHELPVQWRCVAVAAAMLKNTSKPITFWFHDRASAKYLVELLIALRGSEAEATRHPAFYPFFEPISPLRFPFDGIDLLFETARLNLPVPIGPMVQMGISAPATIAGTLAQENAEILAGVCITQLIRAGMPICYGGICHAFDMGTTQMIFAGPEQAIFGVAMTQMGKHYGFPVYVNTGLTDAKCPDAQAGMEAGITLALSAAAGADIYGHMGICGVDQATSLEMLLLQDEIIGYVKSVMRQLEFSDETLGFDVVRDAAAGEEIIAHDHTAEHFRQELYFPRLLDRAYYQGWLDAGAKDLASRCQARCRQILATHEPEPIAPELSARLDEVVNAAKKDACRPKSAAAS
jgi:trimethylamine--corrinoid protein Co-methyltransferase